MISYRAELIGLLGAVLLTYCLTRDGDFSNLTGIFWYDNKVAVNVFNELEGELPYSLKTANQTDSNVIKELQYWKSKLLPGISTALIKVHQKNILLNRRNSITLLIILHPGNIAYIVSRNPLRHHKCFPLPRPSLFLRANGTSPKLTKISKFSTIMLRHELTWQTSFIYTRQQTQ